MRRTVLIVDDEGALRRAIGRMAKAVAGAQPLPFPMDVLEAEGPEKAQEILSAHGEMIDLVISDGRMDSSQTGLDLLRWTRERDPKLPFILMSGDFSSVEKALAASRDAQTLDKPFRVDDFRSVILPFLRPHILVAEDDEAVREALVLLLEGVFGDMATIHQSVSGAETRQRLADERIDALLTDNDGVDGLEIIRNLRGASPYRLPVAVLTGRPEAVRAAATVYGFTLFAKPAPSATIIDWIKTAVAG